jgi:hypothetical protein
LPVSILKEIAMDIDSPATMDRNQVDYWLGTNFAGRFVLDNVVDAVIAFANGDVRPDPDLHVRPFPADKEFPNQKLYASYSHSKEEDWITLDREVALKGFAREVEDARKRSIEILGIAVEGLTPLATFFKTYKRDEDDGDIVDEIDLALYPTLTFEESGRPRLGWRISGPGSMATWAKVAAVLIADKARGELTDVGQCQLDSCGRFFRIKRDGPGKPSRKYCPGTDHMERAHALASTARSRRKRQRDAAKPMKKRRRALAGKK